MATIGIENILGDLATRSSAPVIPSAVLTEGGTICLDFEGPSFDPITLGYDVTVDAGDAAGHVHQHAVHVTDDPVRRAGPSRSSVAVDRVCTETITAHPCRGADGLVGNDLRRRSDRDRQGDGQAGAGLVVTNDSLLGPLTTNRAGGHGLRKRGDRR